MPSVLYLNLFFCLIVHFHILSFVWIGHFFKFNSFLTLAISQGLAYLLYPLCGWLTEVYSSSFKVLKWSFIPLILSSVVLIVVGTAMLDGLKDFEFFLPMDGYFTKSLAAVFIIISLTGLGMYEANAIQFAMDQMLDAPSEQLSSFIHWYYWCTVTGPLAVFYLLLAVFSLGIARKIYFDVDEYLYAFAGIVVVSYSCFQLLVLIPGYFLCIWSKRFFCTQPISRNSLRLLYQVLKFSFHHKYPERRSAFTYCEDDLPSRIDLGKDKYGGPFTYEQVEDVKTFFRLLLLILSLFGIHVLGEGYAMSYYIMNKAGCPSYLGPFAIILNNPQHIPLLIAIIAIPIFQVVKKLFSQYIPNLLSRLWFGLFSALVAQSLQFICSMFVTNGSLHCNSTSSLISKCLYASFEISFCNNISCTQMCSSTSEFFESKLIYIFVFPLVFYGLSNVLISVTVVEFICAQSPNSMKGLLIGIWYSTLSIKFIVIDILDSSDFLLIETIPWSVYNCVKGLTIFLSIAAFSLVKKHYRYRERNEVVNVQNILEVQYERELLMNDSQRSYGDSISVPLS